MLIYRDIDPSEASIRKGRGAKATREKHGLSVDQWAEMLQDSVDIDLTPDHIDNLEAGCADLATAAEWHLRTAEQGGLINRL